MNTENSKLFEIEPMIGVIDLLRADRKIDAIKRVKETTGFGLKEAKDFVESLARFLNIALTYPNTPARNARDDGSYSYTWMRRNADGSYDIKDYGCSYEQAMRYASTENYDGDEQFLVARVVAKSIISTTLHEVE